MTRAIDLTDAKLLDGLRRASPEILRSIVRLGGFRSSVCDLEEMLRPGSSHEHPDVREGLSSQTEWRAYDELATIAAGEIWEPDLPEDGDRAEMRTIVRDAFGELLTSL